MANQDWSQLPPEALTNLMSKVGPAATRGMHSLAFVCTSWAEAEALDDELEVYM
jgi:hypothetical protein